MIEIEKLEKTFTQPGGERDNLATLA